MFFVRKWAFFYICLHAHNISTSLCKINLPLRSQHAFLHGFFDRKPAWKRAPHAETQVLGHKLVEELNKTYHFTEMRAGVRVARSIAWALRANDTKSNGNMTMPKKTADILARYLSDM